MHSPEEILHILDTCAESYSFPMLDHGYVYLAASRLSLFRDEHDWALVFEIFGFSPRGGVPDLHIQTFASRLHNRDRADQYSTPEAHALYLARNPHNEYRSIYPIEGDWIDEEEGEYVDLDATHLSLRGRLIALPPREEYAQRGILLDDSERVQLFEVCRWLAAVEPEGVLATPEERRVSVPPELTLLRTLDAWHHPDLAEDERPSDNETFRQIAWVLSTGELHRYRPTQQPNNHWCHWPDGGSL